MTSTYAAMTASPPLCLCRHCGQPAPAGRNFCCDGCESVYALLLSRGLSRFYELRDRYPLSPAKPVRVEEAAAPIRDPGREATLYIEGIHCLGCLWLLEQLPEIDPGILESKLDIGHQLLRVTLRPGHSWEAALRLISRLGYRARLLENGGYRPVDRQRPVSLALRAYAAMATSADRGAVRDVEAVERAMREQELRGAASLV